MSKAVVIVQARISSSRLPAKSLLNIGDRSVIETIARRLASNDYDLIFAVPNGDEGEIIERQIKFAAAPRTKVVFGSLNNVLERFAESTKGYSERDIVVRLTADNLIPDELFVRELIEKYDSGYGYACINDTIYGASAEIFRKHHLDEAYENATTDYEREHVTPYIRATFPINNISHDCELRYHIRLTLDNLYDYIKLTKLFSYFDNASDVGWKELINKAYDICPAEPKVMIGTAQFGMDYGISNKAGRVSADEIANIINCANAHSISGYDTAAEYGESEKVLGDNANILSNARIITKLGRSVKSNSEVGYSILRSCVNLKRGRLDGVLLHNFQQFDSKVWGYLRRYKAEGVVGAIGVSVYSPEEAVQVASEGNSDIVQIPFNILDHRWDQFFEQYAGKIEIQARSIFLQGCLLNDQVLMQKGFANVGEELDRVVKQLGRTNRTELCIAYVKSHQCIDHILMGVDNLIQAQANISYFNTPNLSCEQMAHAHMPFRGIPVELLDVRKW